MSPIEQIQEYFNDYYKDSDVEPLSEMESKLVIHKLKKLGFQDGDYNLIEMAVEDVLLLRHTYL